MSAKFSVQIEEWVDKTKVDLRLVSIEAIQDISEQIVVRSPYKTGFLRGSWFASLDKPPSGVGRPGQDAIGQVVMVAATLQIGQTFFLGNTANYARRLEFGFVGQDSLGRNYNQKGRYWVTGVMNSAHSIVMAAATRVAKGQLGGTRAGGGGVNADVGFVK